MRRFGFASFGLAVLGVAAFVACDDTVDAVKLPPDAGAATDAPVDAPVTTTDGGADSATVDGGSDAGDPVARGKYIVENLAACGDCHTPRKVDGSPDMTKFLSGVDCFAGVDLTTLDAGSTDAGGDAGDAGDAAAPSGPPGCLSSRNLTNDPTGLQNRTDQEIINMFQHGLRPNNEALAPVMPYWEYANMTDADAKAIVAYLRTVPGVSHTVKAKQAPWTFITTPAPALNLTTVPAAPAGNDSAARGRYLATAVSSCIDCHTRETTPGNGILDTSMWFAGSKVFPAAQLGLPTPPFPAVIYSANLTNHASGLAGWTAADIVNALKQGKSKDDAGICPPMPVGPHGPFGGYQDSDANDVAAYILSLPGISLTRPDKCVAP